MFTPHFMHYKCNHLSGFSNKSKKENVDVKNELKIDIFFCLFDCVEGQAIILYLLYLHFLTTKKKQITTE